MEPNFNRYDICEAYYWFGAEWHGGMFTKEYAYLGRAHALGFKPGANDSSETLSENGKLIYDKLVQRMES